MPRNMIIRMGVDASDFQKKMTQAGATAESTGKRIKKGLSESRSLSADVAKIMGWSGASTGVGSIHAGNVETARSQLDILKTYRDQLADVGFDDYQFGAVSERIKELAYDLTAYENSLKQAAQAENDTAEEAEDLGQEVRKSEVSVTRATRSVRNLGSSGSHLTPLSGHLRRIGHGADFSHLRVSRLLRSIRNLSLASFALRITTAVFGELQSTVREYISSNEILQAQVNGLKASLGQALAPAVNLVTGALSYLMPYVVGVSNAIGQLMAALTGSGWSAAASGAGKTAAATGSAAKAQKEMNRQLLSFDQITKLSGEKDSASGGGAGSAITPIEGKTPAWAERFRASFSELFTSEEFQSANIGGKIGMALQTGLDWLGNEKMNFDWRGAGQKLWENFASFSDSGAGSALAHSFGVSIGAAMDMAIGLMGPRWAEMRTAYRNEGVQGAIAYVIGLGAGLVGNTISAMFERILGPVFYGIGDYFRQHGNDSIAGFFTGIGDWMVNAGQWIRENVTDPIVSWFKDLLGIHSPSTVFAEIGENCMDGMGGGISEGVGRVLGKLTDLKDRVLGISGTLKEAFSFDWKMPHLRLPHLSVQWDPVDNILAQFFGVTAFPRLSVSWFAKGGILDGATIFGRIGSTLLGGGERGREAILPLDSNNGWMDDIAQRIAMTLNTQGGGDVNAVINLILDGDILTTRVVNGLRRRARAGTASI